MKLTLLGVMISQYLNAPYRWGANGPFAFDCSGLALKALNDVGLLLPDMTSKGLFEWSVRQEEGYECEPTEPDCLVFYGKDVESITHVAVTIGNGLLVEAGGSGRSSSEMSLDQLAAKDARVRIKSIDHRRDMVASIKIHYPGV